MVFKLVRIDSQEPCKIQLTIGKHVIGRGKFLHIDETDKRVSRNHAELVVTPDTVSLKSLHQNPCFFMKKSIETHLLHQDTTVCLCHGDKFGLLPDHFWYEVLHCPDQDSVEERATISETTENGVHNYEDGGMNQALDVMEHNNVIPDTSIAAEESINFDGGEEEVDAIRSASPSLLTVNEEAANQATIEPEFTEPQSTVEPKVTAQSTVEPKVTAQSTVEPEISEQLTVKQKSADQEDQNTESYDPPAQQPRVDDELTEPQATVEPETTEQLTVKQESADQEDQNTETYDPPAQQPRVDNARTPSKRDHSSDEPSPVDVKKVKIERVDAGDAAAGPSNGQASSDNDTKDNIVAAAPLPKPTPPARERCIYGANCYRRNPQHKAQFSHPADADWGTGDRGVCPYGLACRKADPRHWDNHTHPPGTQRPSAHAPRPGMQVVQRHGNVYYINAHSVNFHDDHFQVEDSDGDSVDYDYEF